MAKKEYKPKKDLITTITGTVFTAATAAAPFYPQYAMHFAAAQAIAGALFAMYAKDKEKE